MKSVKYIISVAVLMMTFFSNAQTLNWSSLSKEQKHIINLNVAAEHALNYGIGYGYKLESKMPIVLSAEYSFPSGNNLTDDFKTKIGGQTRLLQLNDFHFSARVQGVFRRYQTSYARLLNFGSDMAAVIGYYKPKWFVAGEAGFDKAIVTHFKHSDFYKQNFPDIKDGWYEPATGGNFYYGIQTGYSKTKFDIYLKAGKLIEQDFKTNPMLPFYAQVGINLKFRK